MRFLPWPGESQLRQSRATQLTVHGGCFSVSIIHRTLTQTTGSLTCAQMLMHVIAHGVCTDTRNRVGTESWLGEKNPLPHQGIEPASAAWRSDALPMSYIPMNDNSTDQSAAVRYANIKSNTTNKWSRNQRSTVGYIWRSDLSVDKSASCYKLMIMQSTNQLSATSDRHPVDKSAVNYEAANLRGLVDDRYPIDVLLWNYQP